MPWLMLWLACSTPAPAPEPPPVDPVRGALHAAELQLLQKEAAKRLESGAVLEAATPLLAAERLGGLPELNDRAVELADSALAAELHAALADAIRSNPSRAARHHQAALVLATRGSIAGRYGDDASFAALTGLTRGVDRKMTRPVLQSALDHHVDAPTVAALASAGANRLVALCEDPGAKRRLPGLASVLGEVEQLASEPPAELEAVAGALESLLDKAVQDAPEHEQFVVAEFVEGALGAMDRHTRVTWPAMIEDYEIQQTGIEVGVGLELDDSGPESVVVQPVPDGPAWRAGVHQGDALLAVRDEAGRHTSDVQRHLRGPVDSEVTLELRRGDAPLELVMKREPVAMQTVHGFGRAQDNTPSLAIEGHPDLAYLRVASFRSYTDERAGELLGNLEPRAVVLDLRGNSGGDVQAAANLVDLFVGEGIVATLEGPGAPPPPAQGEVAWNALLEGSPHERVPLAVLIDRDTASAAEIAAGGLAQRDGVLLIGERTYGKGRSQGWNIDETYGFALQVTNSTWKLPDGTELHRTPGDVSWGVTPDIELVESAAERWQNSARRTALEFPRSHADGTAMTPPEPGRREGLPVLRADAAIERAIWELNRVLRESATAR